MSAELVDENESHSLTGLPVDSGESPAQEANHTISNRAPLRPVALEYYQTDLNLSLFRVRSKVVLVLLDRRGVSRSIVGGATL